jgi:hypothetical protein
LDSSVGFASVLKSVADMRRAAASSIDPTDATHDWSGEASGK